MPRRSGVLGWVMRNLNELIVVLTPTLLTIGMFTFGVDDERVRCAFVTILMGVYWVFEVLPLAITALIPLVAFPVFGIMKSDTVAKSYLPDISFLFMGGLMVAVAVEKCKLHTRIALFVLNIVGSHPRNIMLGFMIVTAFLSMWISNTATAALMVPIVQSVVVELVSNNRMQEMMALTERQSRDTKRQSVEYRRLSVSHHEHNIHPPKDLGAGFSNRELRMAKGLLISICYSANIGGAATITGTASNLVLIGQLEKLFPRAATGINFMSWMVFAFPLSVLCLISCWIVLCLLFLRDSPRGSPIITRKLMDKYESLPPVSFAEIAVMFYFSIMLCLWLTREPQVVPGFGELFKPGYVTDATSAVLISIFLFLTPNKLPKFLRGKKKNRTLLDSDDEEEVKHLLEWEHIQEKFPWSVVILLGGGFALAAGIKEAQLSHEIGELMRKLDVFPVDVVMGIVILITLGLTNICSNTVIASIFIPIVSELARSLDVNPLYYMLPVALSSSFAFMLPVATPPNAIVFSAGVVKVKDMMISGLVLTVFCFGWTCLAVVTWGKYIFTLDEFPLWAYDEQHPMSNMTLIQEMLSRNLTVSYPSLPFPSRL